MILTTYFRTYLGQLVPYEFWRRVIPIWFLSNLRLISILPVYCSGIYLRRMICRLVRSMASEGNVPLRPYSNWSVLISLCDLSNEFMWFRTFLFPNSKDMELLCIVLFSIWLLGSSLSSWNELPTQWSEIAHEVPQSLVLGPLLFSIMMNDLCLNGRTLLFAVKTALLT